MGTIRSVLLAASLFVSCTWSPAQATVWRVENFGTDSASCGTAAAPCRSITQAVANSLPNDSVKVGPGYYSDDLDGDTVLGEPGEEAPAGIVVGHKLSVAPYVGSAVTFVTYTGTATAVFQLGSPDASLGAPGRGFHIRSTNPSTTLIQAGDKSNVVANVLEVPSGGVGINADNALVRDNRITCLSASGSTGVITSGGQHASVRGNVVMVCDTGIQATSGEDVRGNYALSNMTGYHLAGSTPGPTTSNYFRSNAAIGNSLRGILVDPGTTFTKIYGNVLFGNGGLANCGLENNTGGALNVLSSFWGASTGPGPDPADDVCNVGASTTTTAPFRPSTVTVPLGAIR